MASSGAGAPWWAERTTRADFLPLALVSGVAAGVVGGLVLQLLLAQLLGPLLDSDRGWEAGGVLLGLAALAVLGVPALRRVGAGFALGFVLGALAQFVFLLWVLSQLS